MGFSRKEYWSELPFPPPGDLPDPWIEPVSPAWLADSLPPEPPGKPHKEGGGSKADQEGPVRGRRKPGAGSIEEARADHAWKRRKVLLEVK